MTPDEIKTALQKKMGLVEGSTEDIPEDVLEAMGTFGLEQAAEEGYKAFIDQLSLEDGPYEGEKAEAWENGWKEALNYVVVSAIVVNAKALCSSESPEEVSYFFEGLSEAVSGLTAESFDEFNSFLKEATGWCFEK